MSVASTQPSLKRKRGASHAVLQAAKTGGDIARTAFIKKLEMQFPSVGKRLAQSSLFMPRGRSGVRHVLKNASLANKFASRNRLHHHDMMRKYNRSKPINGVKSHVSIYAS